MELTPRTKWTIGTTVGVLAALVGLWFATSGPSPAMVADRPLVPGSSGGPVGESPVGTPSAAPSPEASASASASPRPGVAPERGTACAVSAILVNSCRPWLGARANDYPAVELGFRSQTEHHEQRIGRQLDIAHTYTAVGGVPLSHRDDRYLAKRAGTYLFANWKPAARWRDAGGGNAEVEARIDRAAANIASVAPKKIFFTLHHEPENDVSSADGCATKEGASAGTPAEYRQMWKHIRERFDAKGVRNVVWVMDYMNYAPWDCLVPQLYPGDGLVDWIMFNAYGNRTKADFGSNVDRFYKLLTAMNGPGRQTLSKPWGIVEWGVHDASPAQARSYYDQASQALAQNRFPRLKAYMIFDSPGTHDMGGLRIGFDDSGRADPLEQDAYRRFANHPQLSG